MTSTRLGGLLVALGAAVIVLSALADQIGISSGSSAFGWKQTVGVVAGAVVLAAGGLVLLWGRRRATAEPTADAG